MTEASRPRRPPGPPSSRYPPGVDFEVITDASGSYDNYTGKAEYELLDGGVLQVVPGDEGRVKKILYGTCAWSRVEVLSDGETPPP